MAKELITGDKQIKGLKVGDKRLSDGKGLYLLPFVKGGSHGWRFDYTFKAKRKTLSLGTYPATGLKLAREKAASFRTMVASGIDPSADRKATSAEEKRQAKLKKRQRQGEEIIIPGSFKDVALQWHEYWRECWAPSHASTTLLRLKKHVFPDLGSVMLKDITVTDMRSVFDKLENAKILDTAHRVRGICRSVFAHAAGRGLVAQDFNPAEPIKLRPARSKRFAAVKEPDELAPMLLAMDTYSGSAVVRAALQLLPLLTVRPGNLRHARWSEFDLDCGWWRIPASRMKRDRDDKENGRDHWVALPVQAVQILRALQPLTAGREFLFPNQRSPAQPISENSLNAALRSLGFSGKQVTSHGFRSTARTILDEVFYIDPVLLEVQLSHKVPGPHADTYARVEYKEFRFFVMQMWADYLDALRKGPAHAQAFVLARRARFGPRRLEIEAWRRLGEATLRTAAPQTYSHIRTNGTAAPSWGAPDVCAIAVPRLPTTPTLFGRT